MPFPTLFPEKRISLKEKCQELFPSENELWLHQFVQKVRQECANPCRAGKHQHYIGKRLEEILKDLPSCDSPEAYQCMWKVFLKTKPKDSTSQPCVRVRYLGISWNRILDIDKTEFNLLFKDPPMMTVKEEYLIYDYVGLISSVGGILGICVGISFSGISEVLVSFMMVGMDWIQRGKKIKEEKNVGLASFSWTRNSLQIKPVEQISGCTLNKHIDCFEKLKEMVEAEHKTFKAEIAADIRELSDQMKLLKLREGNKSILKNVPNNNTGLL